MQTWHGEADQSVLCQGQYYRFATFRLLHWVWKLCCLKLSALRSMVVSFGVLCSSNLLISYVLLIMMLLGSCCANHDGVVRLDFLHLIMFRHLLPWCVNWCTHFWVRYISATTLLFMPRWTVIYIFGHLQVAEYIVLILYILFFSFLLVCTVLLSCSLHGLRVCYWMNERMNEWMLHRSNSDIEMSDIVQDRLAIVWRPQYHSASVGVSPAALLPSVPLWKGLPISESFTRRLTLILFSNQLSIQSRGVREWLLLFPIPPIPMRSHSHMTALHFHSHFPITTISIPSHAHSIRGCFREIAVENWENSKNRRKSLCVRPISYR